MTPLKGWRGKLFCGVPYLRQGYRSLVRLLPSNPGPAELVGNRADSSCGSSPATSPSLAASPTFLMETSRIPNATLSFPTSLMWLVGAVAVKEDARSRDIWHVAYPIRPMLLLRAGHRDNRIPPSTNRRLGSEDGGVCGGGGGGSPFPRL
ncbi:hypothetical protein BDP81DRAFT_131076 [Colletotrichum phormii]|uniref:Uncharacterized protein n=1 Tax=Colletotrichum phormii TaxID=359342 RepID=A0AAJ0A2G4_9PEZI|nr:uncharacterized protein BDP81DRAFT_131076 [Colletotrichum phormii]KAK1641298.1 hypothetical protein BDP81DRAFT_131076 [Colletotrichum phormii]